MDGEDFFQFQFAPSRPKTILHVKQNSAELLNDLFDVINPSSPKYRPPNLVPWQPQPIRRLAEPRYESSDSGISDRCVGSPEPPAFLKAELRPKHSRAFSSPASLQKTLAEGFQLEQQNQLHHQHAKQHSYDDLLSNVASCQQAPQTISDAVLLNSMPLPGGWEQAKTPDGKIYYIE